MGQVTDISAAVATGTKWYLIPRLIYNRKSKKWTEDIRKMYKQKNSSLCIPRNISNTDVLQRHLSVPSCMVTLDFLYSHRGERGPFTE